MPVSSAQLDELNRITWGTNKIEPDVFQRWCQGFYFSAVEPSALVQCSGGPCAVIASVQSAILRNLLFNRREKLNGLQASDSLDLLLTAVLDIMSLVSRVNSSDRMYWAHWSEDSSLEDAENASSLNKSASSNKQSGSECTDSQSSSSKTSDMITMENFLQGLKFSVVNSLDELHGVVLSLAPQLQTNYGVLCFLYSTLLTHGLVGLHRAMADDQSDTLIDPVHGHASQRLINLLISGRSTPHLFDGERNVSGITLTGIPAQPKTGFLTLFEALCYCEAGWYLKNPSYPVWILGSETHFTVLASPEPQLVCEELDGPSNGATLHQAEVEFSKLSTDQDCKTGFIVSDRLSELLQTLNIQLSEQCITDLKRALDPEGFGIILEEPFLKHFFPAEMAKRCTVVRDFPLLHYNGLVKSNIDGQVRYQTGDAHLLDPTEELTDLEPVDNSPIHRCLRTKWPTIRVKWHNGITPSLN